jgi:HAD superfamily hydrolase (TIGR01490 family)
MPQDKIILAIFDFDGTLTEGHLWKGIAKHHQAKRIKRTALFMYMASHLPYWLAAKVKLYPDDQNRARWGRDLSTLFKNFSLEEARSAFEWVTANYFMPLMRPDVMKVMQEHRQAGYGIVLLSGMFSAFLEVVGQKIGVDYVVGTPLEIKNGIYTGKIVPPLCFGDNKANYLQGFIQKQGIDVDFAGSYAYADSIYDNPVFRLVGHPVAVYPDKELLEQARQHGWVIIGRDLK